MTKDGFLDMLPAIRETARSLGYAIGLHGTLDRDYDLIAVPWVAEAVNDWDLAQAIFKVTGCVRWRVLQNQGVPKPHGRLVYCFDWDKNNHENKDYIDLSIMPRMTFEDGTV